MDDDWKEKRNKPQQKLYQPGSGPLRRSNYADVDMSGYEVTNGPRGRDHSHYGSKNSIYEEKMPNNHKDHSGGRNRKPEQQLYVPRTADAKPDDDRYSNPSQKPENANHSYGRRNSNNKNNAGYSRNQPPRRDRSYVDGHSKDGNSDVNYNRNFRQVSEPRNSSPLHRSRESSIADRNRDTRSMETSAGRHNTTSGGGKPPSGRRNSAGYASDSARHKYMLNLENLPPRLKKKFLEQAGHHTFDNDYANRDKRSNNSNSAHGSYNTQGPFYNQQPTTTWSQTLPSRGRGRLRENDGFDREKFLNSYYRSQEQSSRRSTPSSSYMNLYELNSTDKDSNETADDYHQQQAYDAVPKNGVGNICYDQKDEENFKLESDSETVSYGSTNLMDMTNLDWTEEVENSMKDDLNDSPPSSPIQLKISVSQDARSVEPKNEIRDSKRSGRSKRRDKRSTSRGQKPDRNEKKNERNRKDSIPLQEAVPLPPIHRPKERERRDSHLSNRSSTIGNSRDDLDRWRSLRSFSREQSTEGRIVSQCNSRDTSASRALSPRDHDGFRVPSAVHKNANWPANQQKKDSNNGAWGSARGPSLERGGAGAGEAGGGARRSRRRTGRRRGGRGGDTGQSAPAPVPAPAPAPVPAPAPAPPGRTNSWRDEIIESKKHSIQDRLDRHQEVNRNRLNSCQSDKSGVSESSASHPGLIVLPQNSGSQLHKDRGREGSADVHNQKMLYDHQNPSKPIIVQSNPTKFDSRMDRAPSELARGASAVEAAEGAARAARHRPLLQEVDRADALLSAHTTRGPRAMAQHWGALQDTRTFLQNALKRLLMTDLKYCQADNVEHHFWKILYYNFIEILRKSLPQLAAEDKTTIVKLINTIIEEGNTFFESLVQALEKTYKFNTEDYINDNHLLPPKGLGYVGLALISVQKLYVFLGDLARYKEQVNETSNYAKSKFWYTKAQQVNPKNGRPYNQLAILAVYARRKLDAVYYYMRSLMSSNPFHSARESLISLFDENRKKYEAAERKRRALVESSSADATDGRTVTSRGLRREVWVRPGGGRTTTLRRDPGLDQLANMTPVELNKNFITSYLHVHGKLVTKIGMETLHESAALMLRQYRALLHQQPLPTPAARLLQLTALNMFAVESTLPSKESEGGAGAERSAWVECALGVSLLMFGALLERCCALLPEPQHTQQHADALLLLPAIKVWSDWMLCHSSVWNPPPSLDSFDIGGDSDPWDWLARLMNILEELDDKTIVFESEMKEGYASVRLPEDSSLAGFTPLMYMEPSAAFVGRAPAAAAPPPPHLAEHALRTRKLQFFGTEYLVGVEPPVLRLEYSAGAAPRYVSAVTCAQPPHLPLQDLSEDSEEDSSEAKEPAAEARASEGAAAGAEGADEATRRLLRRKEQLEGRRANMERRKLRMQELLRGGWVSVEVEVRPRWLVPDTNCFIDHLALLSRAVAHYSLAVPLVVVTELEGLRRCSRVGSLASAALAWLGACGAGAAGAGAVRFATTRGSLLTSLAFTAEQEGARATNDDRVLATAVSLHENIAVEPDAAGGGGRCVRRVREVVLLTDDRNLRVKALAAELPARDLPSFVEWAALPTDEGSTASAAVAAATPAQ